MTMSMAHPALTTLNTSKKRKKPNAKQIEAAAKHEAWLRSQGLHPEQLAIKNKGKPGKLSHTLTIDRSGPQCGNGFAPGTGAKKSVFDSQWKRTYESDPVMAEREVAALKRAEARKADLMPLYNKGPIQVNTGLKATELGKRR